MDTTTTAADPAMIRSGWVCSNNSVPVKFLASSLKSAVGQLGLSTSAALRSADHSRIHGRLAVLFPLRR